MAERSVRIRTVDDAWQAGYDAACAHGDAPTACQHCRLTPDEITRIAALLRIGMREHATA